MFFPSVGAMVGGHERRRYPMALPQPSQPAHTLPGELALGLALVINSLGVVLMLRSGRGNLRHFQPALRPVPGPAGPLPWGRGPTSSRGRWWPGSWCCAGGLSPPICSASWWGSCSASCWTFRRGGSPPCRRGAALAGGVFPAELPADLPGHRPVQPLRPAHHPPPTSSPGRWPPSPACPTPG